MLRKSLHFCQKLTIGNLLEMIKYKITVLQHSQLSTGILQKNFNGLMEEPEKAPELLTTGITYLLPKLGDSKEVRNYRPIICITTMHKTLTGITHIWKSRTDHQQSKHDVTLKVKGPGINQ